MTTNELKVLSIVWDWGGETSVDIIAREAGISVNYARLLCENLGKEDYIDFLRSKLCKIKSKGKLAVAGKRGRCPQKIVISERTGKFGLGKNKKGRLTLDY